MTRPVDRLAEDFAKAGATYISFHPEASDHVDRTIELIRKLGCRPGLVLNPATPVDYLDYTLDKLDLVLVMSVNPGFGGQSFIPGSLAKLRPAIEPYANGLLWDPAMTGLLAAPSWSLLGGFGILLLLFGRRKRPLIGYAR